MLETIVKTDEPQITNYGVYLYSAIPDLLAAGLVVANAEDLAREVIAGRHDTIPRVDYDYLRAQSSPPHTYDMSTNPVFVAEGIIYHPPENKVLIARREYNPLISHIRDAHSRHMEGLPYYLENGTDRSLMQTAEEDSGKNVKERRVFIFSPAASKPPYSIPTDRLAEDELLVFLFGDLAKSYGLALHELGKREFKISIPSSPDKFYYKSNGKEEKIKDPFANPLVLGRLDGVYGIEMLSLRLHSPHKEGKPWGFYGHPVGLVVFGVKYQNSVKRAEPV